MKKILVFLALSIAFEGQSQESIEAQTQKIMVVQLYRGIVDVTTNNTKEVQIEHKVYDYDLYSTENVKREHEESFFSSNALDIESSPDTILIRNASSRELHDLQLTIPERLQLKIVVQHYGELLVRNTTQPMELQVFNGKIVVANSDKSINATIIRHGDIKIKSSAKKNEVIALSTYRGTIDLSLDADDPNYVVKTDLGEIDNNAEIDLKKGREIQFEMAGEEEPRKTFWYNGIQGSGVGPSIFLVNTTGKIIIR